MSGVFISYRRDDTGDLAGRLADRLRAQPQKPGVFLDVDDIEYGRNFLERITGVLEKADLVLVLIGNDWTGKLPNGARIDSADDVVRMEVARALQSGKRVLPVLVNTARMPLAEALPEDLRPLVALNAPDLRRSFFNHDVEILFDTIWGENRQRAGTSLSKRTAYGVLRAVIGAAVAAALVLAALIAHRSLTNNALEEMFGGRAEPAIILIAGVILFGAAVGVWAPWRKRVRR